MSLNQSLKSRLFCLAGMTILASNQWVKAQDSVLTNTDSVVFCTTLADSISVEQIEYKKAYWNAKTRKTYKVGQILKEHNQYGPVILMIESTNNHRIVMAPDTENLEIDEIMIQFLHGKPFFFLVDRYKSFLIDMEKEAIGPAMQPGINVEYREDAISGIMSGWQFFDGGNYLLGNAMGYGLFCYNIANFKEPKELFRYSSRSSNDGQPYFFLEQKSNRSWNGIISSSDTLQQSKGITRFYTATTIAEFLFKNVKLISTIRHYRDPVFNPLSKLYLEVEQPNADTTQWTIDLANGSLIKVGSAKE